MSDTVEINVKINGKEVPLNNISLETFSKIQDAESEKNTPVFSTGCNKSGVGVLILRLTEEIIDHLETAISNCSYLAIEEDGTWGWGFNAKDTLEDVKKHYDNVKPLFEEN